MKQKSTRKYVRVASSGETMRAGGRPFSSTRPGKFSTGGSLRRLASASNFSGTAESAPRTSDLKFLIICATAILLTLVGSLAIKIQVDKSAFELSTLNTNQAIVRERIAAVEMQLNDVSTSQHLSAQAAKLGMVPAPAPAFLEVGTSKVLGKPEAAKPVAPEELAQLGNNSVPTVPNSTASAAAAVTPPAAKPAAASAAPASAATTATVTGDTSQAAATVSAATTTAQPTNVASTQDTSR